jgi:hypothetical protein
MTLSTLGPKIPTAWTDPPPFLIHSLDVVPELNGLGEAIVRMQVTMRSEERVLGRVVMLYIAINPRNMQIIRIRGVLPGGGAENQIWLTPEKLPGIVIDLSVTKVWETFGKQMAVRR